MTTGTQPRKIHIDDDGKYVAIVPRAFLVWTIDKSHEQIDEFMDWISERIEAGDECALADIPFLATDEHFKAWEEGFSVSGREQ
jgi:hypothetical protein